MFCAGDCLRPMASSHAARTGKHGQHRPRFRGRQSCTPKRAACRLRFHVHRGISFFSPKNAAVRLRKTGPKGTPALKPEICCAAPRYVFPQAGLLTRLQRPGPFSIVGSMVMASALPHSSGPVGDLHSVPYSPACPVFASCRERAGMRAPLNPATAGNRAPVNTRVFCCPYQYIISGGGLQLLFIHFYRSNTCYIYIHYANNLNDLTGICIIMNGLPSIRDDSGKGGIWNEP